MYHTFVHKCIMAVHYKTYDDDETSLSRGSTCRGRIVLATEELKEQIHTNTSNKILAHGIV